MEQATNLFTKGLLLDTHPMVLSNDTLTDCLNGTLITMNGNEVILQNDMGNRRVDKAFLPPGYEPVGMKEYGGIIYVASYNPITNKSLIGSFPSPLKKLSSNTTEKAPTFDFLNFTNTYNTETDSSLGIRVLKSDSFMIPLTKDLNLRAGDKFAVYAENLSNMQGLLTNYNNVSGNKAYTPKNRKYTLQLGILNSQNEFVDITKTLCRWKNINGTWQPVNYTSDVSEAYKFNDGYFISDAFSNAFNENTIADAKLIKERQKIAANTYSYKLVGPLYLKIIMNHIENFNYNIYGLYDNGKATLWIEGYLTYNCPDSSSNTSGLNSNENFAIFDEGIPSNKFGFDLIGKSYSNIEIGKSVYNPNNNTYTVKIVKKYNNITGNDSSNENIFNYVLGVKASIDDADSGVYLRGLSVKGSIDLSLLGSGNLKFNGWRFYNDFEKQTSLLTFAFNAYPEYGKSFTDLRFTFKELNSETTLYYPSDPTVDGLPVYNGKQTVGFGWSEIGLQPKKTYIVRAKYKILDNKSGLTGSYIDILDNSNVIRWFLTTELFNDFYNGGPSEVSDFCDVSRNGHSDFYNQMVILFESKSKMRNLSREKLEIEGSLVTNNLANISYVHKHTYDVNITVDPTLQIKNLDLYPEYVYIPEERSKFMEINNIALSSVGDVLNPQSLGQTGYFLNYSNSLRELLIPIEGHNLANVLGIDPELNLLELKLLESSIIHYTSGKNISGEIKYYDAFKAKGETIDTISNAFNRFSDILNLNNVLPSSGYYGGVIVNFDDITGGLDGHFIDVAINQDSDKGDLPGDDRLKPNWHRVHLVDSDITEDGKYNDANWVISDYLGSIFQHFNDSVKDTDKTFLYYFCEGNKYNPSPNSRYGYNGKNGAAYTRAWWKMPSGEWACFNSLYKRGSSFADFIKSQLGNKDLVYCMYDEYTENDFMYAPKENYIYYDRYNIPMIYTINYKILSGQAISNIVNGLNTTCGNLLFTASTSHEFASDTIEFTLKSSEKFFDNINSVDSENISNVFIGKYSAASGTLVDSMGRTLNPSYVYYLEDGKLHRVDRTDFYVDSANKTRNGGANKLLYNTNRKGSVEDKCQVTDGNDEDSYTRLTYNSLNVVAPV